MEKMNKEKYIPKFSIKSSLLIFFACIISGIILPYFFYELGLNVKIAVMIFLPTSISFSLAFGQCFIETNDKFCTRFIKIFFFSFLILELASYAWLFKGIIF